MKQEKAEWCDTGRTADRHTAKDEVTEGGSLLRRRVSALQVGRRGRANVPELV